MDDQSLQTWEVPSASDPQAYYTVTEKPDTRSGGSYFHCTCPSWATMIRKGGCKHIKPLMIGGSFTGASVADIEAAGRILGMRILGPVR